VFGDREVQVRGTTATVGELLAPIDDEACDSPQEARTRILSLLREE